MSLRLRILWPGKTRNEEFRKLQEFYLRKIRRLAACEVVETREARGLEDKNSEKIKEIEARGLEKRLEDNYIICLFDEGQEMSSRELALFLKKQAENYARPIAFIVGGFSGLAERMLKRANLVLSLSRMTLPHELCRVVLLEQVYRALAIIKGKNYAK